MVVKTVLVSDSDIYKTSNQLNIYTGDPDYDSFTVYLGGENTAVPEGTTSTSRPIWEELQMQMDKIFLYKGRK